VRLLPLSVCCQAKLHSILTPEEGQCWSTVTKHMMRKSINKIKNLRKAQDIIIYVTLTSNMLLTWVFKYILHSHMYTIRWQINNKQIRINKRQRNSWLYKINSFTKGRCITCVRLKINWGLLHLKAEDTVNLSPSGVS
jgi:hypothetical protein